MLFDYYNFDATVVTGTHSPQKQQGFAPFGNELDAMDIAFGAQCSPGSCAGNTAANGWVNADQDWDHNGNAPLVSEIGQVWLQTLRDGGTVWIAEGGMGDFTLDVTQWVQSQNGSVDLKKINSVQHSNWNINNSGQGVYDELRNLITVTKIPDGNGDYNSNGGGNKQKFANEAASGSYAALWSKIWEGDGGWQKKIDFSDTAELLWILEKQDFVKNHNNNQNPWENFMEIFNSDPVPTTSTPPPVFAPTPPPVSAPTSACGVQNHQNECTTTNQCKGLYTGADDCWNGGGGVCMCSGEACGCLGDTTPPSPGVTSAPVSSPTNDDDGECGKDSFLQECTTTGQCQGMYSGATDCWNGGGGVCYCDQDACGCL